MSTELKNGEVAANMVDRLLTVEIRYGKRPDVNLIPDLYDAAREKLGGLPISLLAANKLIENVGQGDTVFLMDGFAYQPNFPYGENDGPLGIASLARSLRLGLGAIPVIVAGEGDLTLAEKTTVAAGLTLLDYEAAKAANIHTATSEKFPTVSKERSAIKSAELFEKYSPKAIISIETVGPNSKGVKHTGDGNDVEAMANIAALEYLIFEAEKRGVLTIGCVDGGNEIGCGTIEEAVRKYRFNGSTCLCPCQGGTVCTIKTDIVYPASVSNWAAYGISAMLSYFLNRPDILQDEPTERRMLEASINHGSVDGEEGQLILSCDAIDYVTGEGMLTLLRKIISTALVK